MDDKSYPAFLPEDFKDITKESIPVLRPFLINSKEESRNAGIGGEVLAYIW